MTKIRDFENEPKLDDKLTINRRRRVPVVRHRHADDRLNKQGRFLLMKDENIVLLSLQPEGVFIAVDTGKFPRPLAVLEQEVYQNLHATLVATDAAA